MKAAQKREQERACTSLIAYSRSMLDHAQVKEFIVCAANNEQV
jgi:hypothetical protein